MAPRAGLTPERVVGTAAAIADGEGLGAVTLARVADELGVRTPSLYNHVEGLDDLWRHLTLVALRDLGQRLQGAAVGRAGDDAVRAIAEAYRSFGHDRPGLYTLTLPASEWADEAIQEAGAAILATVTAALSSYGFEGDDALHATRMLRSALHGFTSLELAGGFALALDLDETFDRLVEMLVTGLRGRRT